eukprot:2543224-Rhodomonas_salina.1
MFGLPSSHWESKHVVNQVSTNLLLTHTKRRRSRERRCDCAPTCARPRASRPQASRPWARTGGKSRAVKEAEGAGTSYWYLAPS